MASYKFKKPPKVTDSESGGRTNKKVNYLSSRKRVWLLPHVRVTKYALSAY